MLETRVSAWWDEGSPWSVDFFCVLHAVEGAMDLSAASKRALIPFRRAPPSGLKHVPKAPPPKIHRLSMM